MRLRATVVTAAVVSTLLAPFASPAYAVTTTSTLLAYIANTGDNGAGELWTRPADGSGTAQRVFTTTYDLWMPALSPDGTQIAYVEDDSLPTDDYPNYRLFVRPVAGGAPTLLSDGDVYSPAWSADGTKVIFFRYFWDTDEFGVFHVAATGGAATLVPTTASNYAEEPSFSPSGRQVAVTAYGTTATNGGIDLVTLSSGTRARLGGSTGGSDPVWSPDGRYLLIQKPLATCGYGLYRIPSGGGTAVPIRVTPGYVAGSAEYSRDGSQIFWTEVRRISCNPGSKAGEIWVANADGSSPAKVTNTADVVEYNVSVAGGTPMAADTTAPAAPVIAAMGTVNATSATVSWTAEGDATEFVVLRKPQGDPAPTSNTDGTLVYRGAARSATATGLTTGAVYDFYVFAIDASGNESPVSLAHAARPTPPPVMATIGRVGTTTTGTTFTVKWAGTAPAYQLNVGEKVKNAAGAWSTAPVYKTLVASTTAKTRSVTGGAGRSYYFQARGLDGYGNATPFAAAKAAHVPVNETSFSYTAGWTAASSASRYLGTYRYTTGAGRYVSYATNTSSFTVIGDKCATCGQFKVYVDGVLKATIDTKATSTLIRQVLYAGPTLGAVKQHSIKIVAVGTAGRPKVAIDGIALTR